MRLHALIGCLVLSLCAPVVPAAEATAHDASTGSGSKSANSDATKSKEKDKEAKDKEKDNEEKLVETTHTAVIGGREIPYKAVAGTILLRDEENNPTASIFYIAYRRTDVSDLTRRPLTFSFNGGPGSSSIWMHLGMLGPRRVHLGDDGSALPPPYRLEDNPDSLLDESDLVFVDPVGTGYSRAIPLKDARKFYGVHEDAASIAEFIRLYVSRNQRWTSPKFLIGESYGTTRAAALSGELSDRLRMNVNGIMLVSSVLNFQTLDFSPGNDLPYELYFPTYATTAWFHHKLDADLQGRSLPEVFDLARRFAEGEYHRALFAGNTLTADERTKVVEQFARFTGLPKEYVDRANLRVSLGRFAAELLAEDRRVIGRYDSRYTGYVRDRLANRMEQDPSYEAVASAFASTFNNYIRADLKYETDRKYEVLAALGGWNWDQSNGYVDVAETLANAITRNPFLRVHVSGGYYDLATPLFATEYTFDHLNVDPKLQSNVTLDTYTAGHMMYLNRADLKKSKADLVRFIHSAVPSRDDSNAARP